MSSVAALAFFFKASSSSFWVLSSLLLGSNFLLNVSMSRWPSLLAKIACSTLIAAIPFAFGFVVTAGRSLAAPGAEGRAAEEPVLVWAEAADAISIAAAIRENTNLGFMRFAKLLGELLLIFQMRNFSEPEHLVTPLRLAG